MNKLTIELDTACKEILTRMIAKGWMYLHLHGLISGHGKRSFISLITMVLTICPTVSLIQLTTQSITPYEGEKYEHDQSYTDKQVVRGRARRQPHAHAEHEVPILLLDKDR